MGAGSSSHNFVQRDNSLSDNIVGHRINVENSEVEGAFTTGKLVSEGVGPNRSETCIVSDGGLVGLVSNLNLGHWIHLAHPLCVSGQLCGGRSDQKSSSGTHLVGDLSGDVLRVVASLVSLWVVACLGGLVTLWVIASLATLRVLVKSSSVDLTWVDQRLLVVSVGHWNLHLRVVARGGSATSCQWKVVLRSEEGDVSDIWVVDSVVDRRHEILLLESLLLEALLNRELLNWLSKGLLLDLLSKHLLLNRLSKHLLLDWLRNNLLLDLLSINLLLNRLGDNLLNWLGDNLLNRLGIDLLLDWLGDNLLNWLGVDLLLDWLGNLDLLDRLRDNLLNRLGDNLLNWLGDNLLNWLGDNLLDLLSINLLLDWLGNLNLLDRLRDHLLLDNWLRNNLLRDHLLNWLGDVLLLNNRCGNSGVRGSWNHRLGGVGGSWNDSLGGVNGASNLLWGGRVDRR